MVLTCDNLFFDDVLVFLVTLSGLSLGLKLQKQRAVTRFGKRDNIIIHRKCCVMEYMFFPHESFETIFKGQWPTSFRLEESKSRTSPGAVFRSPAPLMRSDKDRHKEIFIRLLQAMFLRSYESVKSMIERKYGRSTQGWPDVLKFSWVIRNAFAHDGRIAIYSRNLPKVSWGPLSYSFEDNGKKILFDEMGPGDILKLMEEMDFKLRK